MRYTTPYGITSIEWMKDFVERVKQLARFTQSQNRRQEELWIGGLFAPEAYITATRQLVAQTNGWSLEQLYMHVAVVSNDKQQSDKFTIRGNYYTIKIFFIFFRFEISRCSL